MPPPASPIADPAALVRAFVDAWTRMDFEAVVGALHDEIDYHNIPMAPLAGKAAVRAYLENAWAFEAAEWTMPHIAVAGAAVLTERVDAFLINGRWVRLPVMGVFEIEDGAIRRWRDYFDLTSYQRDLAAAKSARRGEEDETGNGP